MRRRDRCHEVTDEGSSGATVPLLSPSSPPSAELPPKGKPSLLSSRTRNAVKWRDPLASERERGRSLPLPSLCKGGCRAQRGGRVVTVGAAWAGQSLSHFVTAPFTQGSLFYVIPNTERSEVEGFPCKGKKAGMKAFPLGVSHALCAPPRCGVRARRTEVFAIVGKSRDRWRRRSLRRRDRCHEVTDEGSSGATVSLPSPSSPPSAELLPKEKPSLSLTSSRTGRNGKKSRIWRTNGVYFLTKCRA